MSRHILSLLIMVLVSACGSAPERRLERAERELDTDGPITMLFHSSLYYPVELSLRFDGYIVGIEKSPRTTIASPADLRTKDVRDAGLEKRLVEEKLADSKLLFVSHILKNDSERAGAGNCTVYNAYNMNGIKTTQLVPRCSSAPDTPTDKAAAFRNSWAALDELRKSIAERTRSGKYSHIVVITMGWNTVQEESVRNFNSIVSNIKAAAPNDFNPLVIGVTWPSQWNSAWIDPVYKLFSFPTKAADADELGITWLGVLLHETIPDAKTNLPVIVIGHSFGSRASSVAACVGPAIYDKNPVRIRSSIDTLINLQGAFLSSRLFGEDEKGFHYPDGCKNVKHVALTSSAKDQAMNIAFWGVYAGDERSFRRYCNEGEASVRCARVNSDGNFDSVKGTTASSVTYVDASDLITENAYLSGGGAHSDIYRREHGVLIDHLIRRQFSR